MLAREIPYAQSLVAMAVRLASLPRERLPAALNSHPAERARRLRALIPAYILVLLKMQPLAIYNPANLNVRMAVSAVLLAKAAVALEHPNRVFTAAALRMRPSMIFPVAKHNA